MLVQYLASKISAMPKNVLYQFLQWAWAWGAVEKSYRRQAIRLGVLYFAELFVYQAFSLLSKGHSFRFLVGNDWVTLALHTGMLAGALFWCWYILFKPKLSYGQALRGSVAFYTLALAGILIAGLGLVFGVWQPGTCMIWTFAVLRFLFGAGFSAGLGLTVIFIAEEFPRYLRTRATTLACAIGFAGPLVAAGLFWIFIPQFTQQSDWPGVATLTIGFVGALLSLIDIWRQSSRSPLFQTLFFRTTQPTQTKAWSALKAILFQDNTATIFWSCAFMGVSISFFSDLLHLLPRMHYYQDKVTSDFIFCWRYVGIATGTLWAGWQSSRTLTRREVITQALILQIFALLLLLLLPIVAVWIGRPFGAVPKVTEAGKWFCGATLVFSGWANSNWIVMLLKTYESFGKAHRAVAVLLAMNVYRFGSIGLIGLNLLHPEWFNSFHYALLGLGMVYIVIGLVAAQQQPDNFEGDALEISYNPSARPLSDTSLRKKLLEIEDKSWDSEAEPQFLAKVSRILFDRLKEGLCENYYLGTLYFAQESDARLGSAGYFERQETFAERGVKNEHPTRFNTIGEALIERQAFSSLALWLEKSEHLDGILLWYGGTGQNLDHARLDEFTPNGFRTFNLSSIQLPENWALYYKQILGADASTHRLEEQVDDCWKALDKLEQNARFDEVIWTQFWGKSYHELQDDEDKKEADAIRRNLLFQRLEAAGRYRPGLLFIYYLKPHATQQADLRGVLFLKMADQLGKKHLAELREIISWVLLQRAAALLRRSNSFIIHGERHANGHELSALANRLQKVGNWYEALKDRAKKAQFVDLAPQAFLQDFVPALTTAQHLRDLNRYYAFMVRAGHTELSEDLQMGNPDMVAKINCSLCNALLAEVANMKNNPDIMRFAEESVVASCFSKLEDSIRSVFAVQDVQVVANPIALRVVLHELLKNAARHTQFQSPELSVSWEYHHPAQNEFAALHFHNNWNEGFDKNDDAKRKFVETICDGIEHSDRSLGIRSVRNFIALPYFSVQPWKLSCADPREGSAKRTDIFLLIPHNALSTPSFI